MSFTSSSICITSFPVSLFFKGDPEKKCSKYFGREFSDSSFPEKGNRKRRQVGSSLNATALCPGGMDLNKAYQICSEPKSKYKTRLSCSKTARCGLTRSRRWSWLPYQGAHYGLLPYPIYRTHRRWRPRPRPRQLPRRSGCWDEHTTRRVTECCTYFCDNVGNPNSGTTDIFERL